MGYDALHAYLPWLTAEDYEKAAADPDPYAKPVSALRRILVETRAYQALATSWLSREKPDLAVVYFQGTDTLGHVFAPWAPPRQDAVKPEDFERYSRVPELYFAEIDRMLGEYPQARQGPRRRADDRLRSRLPLEGGSPRAARERRRRDRRPLASRGGDLSALGAGDQGGFQSRPRRGRPGRRHAPRAPRPAAGRRRRRPSPAGGRGRPRGARRLPGSLQAGPRGAGERGGERGGGRKAPRPGVSGIQRSRFQGGRPRRRRRAVADPHRRLLQQRGAHPARARGDGGRRGLV